VGSLALLFAVFVSPPPETVAVFVTGEVAFAATSTVRLMMGDALLPFKTSDLVQLGVALTVQDQPGPLIALAVKPAGKVSTTVTAPEEATVPRLFTIMKYVPGWPWMKLFP
jgi:hypothetical protein